MGHFLLGISLIVSQATTAIALPVLNFADRAVPQVMSNSKIRFPQADNRGAPVATSGGGTRGETCLLSPQSILFPVAKNLNVVTTTAHPTIFVYLPEHRADDGHLTLLNAQGDEVYHADVTLSEENAILAIALPESLELEPDQVYGWRFAIHCGSKVVEGATVTDDFTEASLTRLLLKTVDSTLPALDQAQFYAQNSLWNDVLTLMVPLREQEPETWQALLNYLNLGEFADAKVIVIDPSL